MERERLTQLVEEPGKVGRADMSDLNALAERYPWFAGAQVLRSLGEHKSGDVLSEETLRGTSAHVPSRAVLFDLIAHANSLAHPTLTVVPKTEPVGVKALEPVPVTVVVADPIPLVEAPAATVPDVVPGLVAPAPSDQEIEPEVGPIAPIEVVASAERELVVEEEVEATPSVPAEEPEADPLERQIMEAAMASVYDFTWLHEKSQEEKHVEQPSPLPEPPPIFAPPEPVVPIAPFEHKRAVTRHDKLSFLAWLDATEETAPPEAPMVQRNAEIPTAISDWIRAEPEAEAEAPTNEDTTLRRSAEKPAVKPLPKESLGTSDLIDRFIKQQAPVTPPKAEFFTPQQAAKRSLDDKAGLVTETLARVYVQQGNIPKAIEAYKRLALKYPGKSAYFAALAKELEGQLNK